LRVLASALVALAIPVAGATAQDDPLQRADRSLQESTNQVFHFTFQERTRWEEKDGVNFGKSVNQQDMLSRLRIGALLQPVSWLKIYAMGQDARVPFYGAPAPNSIRDTIDLQESYIKLFDGRPGISASFGREMLDYGESRLIGSPQWSNVSKTFDGGRLDYKLSNLQFEALVLSPVKVLPDEFNRPNFGERIWGTYNVFSRVWRGASFDAYALRHSENRIGGWTGLGTLGTNSFGGRFYGPLSHGFAYNFEAVGQTGHLGPLAQHAFAWYAGTSKQTSLAHRPFILSGEYKLASGTNAGSAGSGTFDQLSPANHDKFGHEDLFGWRNLKTIRSVETWKVTKNFAGNLMYSDERLYSATDSLYNSQGSSIARSKNGTAGTHVGQELDAFVTYKYGAHLFGAGFGHFFKGEFIQNTTPGVNPRYFYIFQQYTIK
jgi:hypothetical protein